MVNRCFLTLCSLAALAMPVTEAVAQRPDAAPAIFAGTARTGADTRAVRFRFSCTSNDGPNITGVLSVSLEIPRPDQLRSVFDFDRFEGPDSTTGALTQLQANGVRNKASNLFPANGSSQGAGRTEVFVLEVSASRRDQGALGRLVAVLRPLMDGPGQLVWRQGAGKPGGTPIHANLDLLQERADQLKAALGSCVAAR